MVVVAEAVLAVTVVAVTVVAVVLMVVIVIVILVLMLVVVVVVVVVMAVVVVVVVVAVFVILVVTRSNEWPSAGGDGTCRREGRCTPKSKSRAAPASTQHQQICIGMSHNCIWSRQWQHRCRRALDWQWHTRGNQQINNWQKFEATANRAGVSVPPLPRGADWAWPRQ